MERRHLLQDVDIVAALGHQRETSRRFVSPITSDVRMCEMLPAYGLEVLDVDDLAEDAGRDRLPDRGVIGRVTEDYERGPDRSVLGIPACL